MPGAHLAWFEGRADAADLEVMFEKFWVVLAGIPEDNDLEAPAAERGPWFRSERHIAGPVPAC